MNKKLIPLIAVVFAVLGFLAWHFWFKPAPIVAHEPEVAPKADKLVPKPDKIVPEVVPPAPAARPAAPHAKRRVVRPAPVVRPVTRPVPLPRARPVVYRPSAPLQRPCRERGDWCSAFRR